MASITPREAGRSPENMARYVQQFRMNFVDLEGFVRYWNLGDKGDFAFTTQLMDRLEDAYGEPSRYFKSVILEYSTDDDRQTLQRLGEIVYRLAKLDIRGKDFDVLYHQAFKGDASSMFQMIAFHTDYDNPPDKNRILDELEKAKKDPNYVSELYRPSPEPSAEPSPEQPKRPSIWDQVRNVLRLDNGK